MDARSIEYTKGVKSEYTPLDLGIGTKLSALPVEPCLQPLGFGLLKTHT